MAISLKSSVQRLRDRGKIILLEKNTNVTWKGLQKKKKKKKKKKVEM
jgi:hypothetical protein